MRRPSLAVPTLFATCAVLTLSAVAAQAQYFHGQFSKDGVDVIAVGDSGRVNRSLDGGATWSRSTVGGNVLRDVAARGLTVVMVGDSGKVWRSTDNGGNWSLTVIPGTPSLRALSWPTPDSLFAVGDGGTVLVSDDAGVSWTPQSSNLAPRLNRVVFDDAFTGWIAGDGGALARTMNGGATWTPVALPYARDVYGLDFRGSTVWVVGARALALRSDNDGGDWTQMNLRLDYLADVYAVHMLGADSVYIAGGGGFIRRSVDAGATWTFLKHALQRRIQNVSFAGGRGWVSSDKSPAILRTTDLGDTWSLPSGATQTRSWVKKLAVSGDARGATLACNPLDKKTLYTARGASLYRSRDDGETWSLFSTFPGGSTDRAHAFVISPKDTNLMVAAVADPYRIVRSTDGGLNWTTILTKSYGEYGIPIEMHPDQPDTLYFGSDNNRLLRSINFGATWDTVSNISFRSPCDIVVVPEADSQVIVLGDGVTGTGIGRILRSTDGGVKWDTTFAPTSPPTQSSEIPGMATSRLRNTTIFASAWSQGDFRRSLNRGMTWSTSFATSASWGVDIAKDDPNLVVFGRYTSSAASYLSLDGGDSYLTMPVIGGSNYTFFAKDRSLIFAQQGATPSGGLFKLLVTDVVPVTSAQSVSLAAPDGGEAWAAGSVHDVTWSATNVAAVKIEYRKTAADPWQPIAVVEGYAGHYAWTLPQDETTDASIRVSDAWDAAPIDESAASFTILRPHLAASPDPLDLGSIALPGAASDTIHIANDGLVPLTVSSATSSNPLFTLSRASFSIGASGFDTLTVLYEPVSADTDTTVITLVSDAPGSPHLVTVVASSYAVNAVGDDVPLAFALGQNLPNPFRGRTVITYALPQRARVRLEVFDITGQRVADLVNAEQPAGAYRVPFTPGNLATHGGRGRLRSGVYFYRIIAGPHEATRKMVVME